MSNISPVTQNGIPEVHCFTNIESRKCTFLWTIDQYSVVTEKMRADLRSPVFSAVDDDFKWYLVYRKSIRDYGIGVERTVSFILLPDAENDFRKCGFVSLNVEFSFLKTDNTTMKSQLSSTTIYSDEIRENDVSTSFTFSQTEMNKYVNAGFQDRVKLLCNIEYFKETDIISKCVLSDSNPNPIKTSQTSLSTDFERFYTDDHFKDVTILVKGKNYSVHKQVLAARSSVFNAMFRSTMQESEHNRIEITDIDHETFEEMLHYIYTGKTTNIQESAFELLPVADKYDLQELKTTCEHVLFDQLSKNNAARILILADMHHAEELKAHTLRFIKLNYADCEDFQDTEVWKVLVTCRAELMKDMLAVFFAK